MTAGTASILTIGNELVSGDVANTNAAWLARRLAPLGVAVRLTAALPDEIDAVAELVRAEAPRVDFLLVTGGLGGTPDDLTREAIAAAFGVPQEEVPEVAADLRARFTRNPEYAARWALLPRGSRPLANPRGGAPGFAIENVYVLPGLPSEMEAMFTSIEEELRRGSPIESWRRVYRTYESVISSTLAETGERWPSVPRRLLPELRRRRLHGRDRAQVERRLGARCGLRLARVSDRRGRPTVGRRPRSRR